jgi:hypothetical protein
MEPQVRPSIAESPWFWVMVFSLMALAALAAISGKYGRRQAAIERQYQARLRLAESRAAEENSAQATRIRGRDAQGDRRPFATPGDTLISLWPLAVVLVGVAAFAAVMLVRSRTWPGSPTGEQPS